MQICTLANQPKNHYSTRISARLIFACPNAGLFDQLHLHSERFAKSSTRSTCQNGQMRSDVHYCEKITVALSGPLARNGGNGYNEIPNPEISAMDLENWISAIGYALAQCVRL